MLSRQEWTETADQAAARKWGEDHATLFAIRRGFIPGLSVAIAVGLFLGGVWVWPHASLPHPSDGGIPTGFWLIAILTAVGTVMLFRIIAAPALFFVKLALAALVWIGLVVYAVTAAI